MTGQGAAHVTRNGVSIVVEVRSVNSRYFKLALRSTEGYSCLEPMIDETVRKSIRRGNVQLDVRVDREPAAEDFRLNETALASYRQQLAAVSQGLQLDSEVSLEALLSLPGVVDERPARAIAADEDWPVVETALKQALHGLARMRADEGKAMTVDMAANCQSIGAELDEIQSLAPNVAESYRSRLTDRLNKLLEEYEVRVEPADIIREVGLFAERSDISEEIVRLRSHLEQFDSIMKMDESSGRKLEFITQEMFRETNTIGSKANDAEIARHVIEIKADIERIREMIQNVE